jgi:uncharacterized protein with PQ loop repeat
MDKFTIIAGAVFELVGLIIIVRIWRRRRMRIIPRIFFSIVLLIPFFGLLIYGFLASDLEKNPDRMDTQSDSDAFYGGGGGQ